MEQWMIAAVLAWLQAVLVIFLLYPYRVLAVEHHGFVWLLHLVAVIMYYRLQGQEGFSVLQIAEHFCIFSLLMVLAFIDCRFYQIPNRLLILWGILRLLLLIPRGFHVGEGGLAECSYLTASMAVCLAGMLLLSFFSRRGIGFGDVKLFALLGFWIGLKETYFILFYSILLAAIVGVLLMGMKRWNRKTRIPFAPFILVGYYIVFLMM